MKYVVYVLVGIFLLPPYSVTAECAPFTVNLKWGSKGEQVKALQVLLNKDKRTQVALDDIGSPGKEGMYFGKATYAAVKKYQELHMAELLVPQNLKNGTGYVGSATRSLLNKEFCAGVETGTVPTSNQIESKASTIEERVAALKAALIERQATQTKEVITPPATTPAAPQTQTKTPKITAISPLMGNMGTTVTLTGENFAPSNDILTTTWRFTNVSSLDGKTLSFVVDADKSLLTRDGKITKDLPFTIIVRSGTQYSNVINLKLE